MFGLFTKRATPGKRLADLPPTVRVDISDRPAMAERIRAAGYTEEQIQKFFEVLDEMIEEDRASRS